MTEFPITEFEEDTIVAISTPPGRGGIGVVRLSGPRARIIAERLIKLRHPLAPAQARFAEVLDSTGETLAEADIDLLHASEITAQIQSIQAPLAALERTFTYGRIVREGFTLAIIGRPNVGKSSLFNRLIERDRAIVTATPGTTRDLVTEHVSLDGIPVELIDTAGLRESTDEAESIGIAKSREAMAEADVVLLVLDATAPIHQEDEAAIAALATRPFLIVLNKQDLNPAAS